MSRGTLWGVCAVAVLLVGVHGCDRAPESIEATTSLATGVSDTTSSMGQSEDEAEVLLPEDVPTVFTEMASSMGGVPVFAVVDLPEGAVLAESWLPVIEETDGQSTTESGPNPRIVGAGGEEPEGQLVLEYGNGWLVVIENFRGDLGDVVGDEVGKVAGQSACLYEVNGGWLVQWSFEGRWYGVFGRDVETDAVVSLALKMALLEGD